ncbi:helix-turn-helix transcriptional regulator [Pannonibacter sp. Pt2]|uniref:Helix-turn-helix transcriptional regulator n=1 Tax=Pannonibacter anstelovis TaxID=3121537 RepID=A0ABU7ZSJ4_9HYPH
MTPDQIRSARDVLGLTQHQMAVVLGFEDHEHTRQNVAKLERGTKSLDTARIRLLQAYLAGYRPADWPA